MVFLSHMPYSVLRGLPTTAMDKSTTDASVRTEGKVLNAGRRAATAEARILDGKGRLLAHATTTCLVFEIPASP